MKIFLDELFTLGGLFQSYSAVNLVCAIVVLVIIFSIKKNGMLSKGSKFLMIAAWLFFAFLITEVIYGFVNGKTGSQFSYVLNYLCNLFYLLLSVSISYCWLMFIIDLSVKDETKKKKYFTILSIPLLVFLVLDLIPNLVFSIDKTLNVYSRGPLHFVQVLFSFAYMIIAGIISIHEVKKTYNYYIKKEYSYFIYFTIIPIVGVLIQQFDYSISYSSIAIMAAFLLIHIGLRDTEIKLDGLTGLYNRTTQDYELTKIMNKKSKENYYLILLDIDGFKKVNDIYGHTEGDKVLLDIALILRKATIQNKNVTAFRYGGDEFSIIVKPSEDKPVDELVQSIKDEIKNIKIEDKKDYAISLSSGYTRIEETDDNIQIIIDRADDEMYKNKGKIIQK